MGFTPALILAGVVIAVIIVERSLSGTRRLVEDKVERGYARDQYDQMKREVHQLKTRCASLEGLLKNNTVSLNQLTARVASVEQQVRSAGLRESS